ncbi:unnamed protein product, partial [Heterotrigona itama]
MMQCAFAQSVLRVKVKVSRSYENIPTSEQFEKWNGTEESWNWDFVDQGWTQRNNVQGEKLLRD